MLAIKENKEVSFLKFKFELDLENSIVTIICNKKEKINHQKFEQVKRLKHGKRQFIFLRPLPFY